MLDGFDGEAGSPRPAGAILSMVEGIISPFSHIVRNLSKTFFIYFSQAYGDNFFACERVRLCGVSFKHSLAVGFTRSR
jgi:hypothetical protein